jgi:hypothetical protein
VLSLTHHDAKSCHPVLTALPPVSSPSAVAAPWTALQALVSECDRDGDGHVSYREFVRALGRDSGKARGGDFVDLLAPRRRPSRALGGSRTALPKSQAKFWSAERVGHELAIKLGQHARSSEDTTRKLFWTISTDPFFQASAASGILLPTEC